MKTKNIFLTLALALSTTFAFAQITNSPHDFSADAWNNNSSGEICNACHTPHNGGTADAPLWSRGVTATFSAYTSTTFTADQDGSGSGGVGFVSYSATPSGVSLLCLTCHDGVQKLDMSGTDATTTMTSLAAVAVRNGGSDEHPISIDYTTELIAMDGGLHPIATAQDRLSSTGTVECSSCHDVHNALNINGGVGLLAATNANSALCTTCHNK